jgi:hypothetical protein
MLARLGDLTCARLQVASHLSISCPDISCNARCIARMSAKHSFPSNLLRTSWLLRKGGVARNDAASLVGSEQSVPTRGSFLSFKFDHYF